MRDRLDGDLILWYESNLLNCIEFSENKRQYINISYRVTDIYYVNIHESFIDIQQISFLK